MKHQQDNASQKDISILKKIKEDAENETVHKIFGSNRISDFENSFLEMSEIELDQFIKWFVRNWKISQI